MATVEALISKLLSDYEKTITQADDRKNFEAVLPARERFLKVRDDVVLALMRQNKRQEALEAFDRELEPVYKDYLAKAATVTDWNVKAGAEVGATIDREGNSTVTGLTIAAHRQGEGGRQGGRVGHRHGGTGMSSA